MTRLDASVGTSAEMLQDWPYDFSKFTNRREFMNYKALIASVVYRKVIQLHLTSQGSSSEKRYSSLVEVEVRASWIAQPTGRG
jgi:hypothetical protein